MTDRPFGAPGMKNITNAGEPARYPVHRIFCAGRRNAAHAPETGAGADRKAWLRCFALTGRIDGPAPVALDIGPAE